MTVSVSDCASVFHKRSWPKTRRLSSGSSATRPCPVTLPLRDGSYPAIEGEREQDWSFERILAAGRARSTA